MHEITVCKFGGSSLADADCFRRVADIIRSDKSRRYIVVSAPGKRIETDSKITDMLFKSYYQTEKQQTLNTVCERFREIASGLKIPSPESELQKLSGYKDIAALTSRGEYLCAVILAAYMDMPFIDAADIFVFKHGALDIKKTYANLRELPHCAIIPGFYGADEHGNIVTFPRSGSDISAAHIAAGIDAGLYENWTDVDGFFTADPLAVKNARQIDRLSYKQARLYAYLGAGVLHYDSIAPAAEAGIPILVRNTFRPLRRGTLICADAECSMPMIAHRELAGGAYIISAMNLTPQMSLRARQILGGGVEHCGMVCTECSAEAAPALISQLHRALITLL